MTASTACRSVSRLCKLVSSRSAWLVLASVALLLTHARGAAATAAVVTESFGNRSAAGGATTLTYPYAIASGIPNSALVVTIGTTGQPGVGAAWLPTGTGAGTTMTCTQLIMGTNRGLNICTLLTPGAGAGGAVKVTLSTADTFTSSATTFRGVSGFRTITSGVALKTFAQSTVAGGSGCTSGAPASTNYTCTLAITGLAANDVLFDMVGQGEPADNTTRTAAATSPQNLRENSATTDITNNNRVATSLVTPNATSSTQSFFFGNSTGANGTAFMVLPIISSAVTAATIGERSAVRFDGVGTRLAWQTEEEVSHLGFQVWREVHGKRTRVSHALVPGSIFTTGDTPLAASRNYNVWDDAGTPDARYWLEELGTASGSRWHGPIASTSGSRAEGVKARFPIGGLSTSFALPAPSSLRPLTQGLYSTLTASRAAPVAGAVLGSEVAVEPCLNAAAAQHAIKLGITSGEWYRVEAGALITAGLRPNASPAELALFVNGKEVALRVLGRDKLEAIEFYGAGLDTRESDTHVYWLVESSAARHLRLRTQEPAVVASKPATASYPALAELSGHSMYFAALLGNRGDNFFGDIIADAPAIEQIALDSIAPTGAAAVEVALRGATRSMHQVQVELNGGVIGSLSWTGSDAMTQTFTVPVSQLTQGANQVRLTRQSGADSVSLVHRVVVTYPRLYRAERDSLQATALAGATVALAGFSTSDVRIVDVTDAAAPVELAVTVTAAGDGTSFSASASIPTAPTGERLLRAFTSAHAGQPSSITLNEPSSLCGASSSEFAILAPHSFFDALAPFVEAKTRAGWDVELVDIEDVYDEMTNGEHRADAIADFIRIRHAAASDRMTHVLLVGDASLDPRNFLGSGVIDVVPTRLVDTATIVGASDDALADVDADGVPDVAIGRWPARSANEARALVARTLSFAAHTPFERGTLLVVGGGDAELQQAESAATPADVPGSSQLLDANTFPSSNTAKSMLLDSWASGPSFVHFVGHGSQQLWQALLGPQDVAALRNTDRLSVVLAMTCLNGYFHDTYQDSFAELMLRSAGGAVAVWASSSLDDVAGHGALSQSFVDLVRTSSLGEAVRLARIANAGSGIGTGMVLFGDPTLFGTPAPKPQRAPSASGAATDDGIATLTPAHEMRCAIGQTTGPTPWPVGLTACVLAGLTARRMRRGRARRIQARPKHPVDALNAGFASGPRQWRLRRMRRARACGG